MSKEFIGNVLNQYTEAEIPDEKPPWRQIRNRAQATQTSHVSPASGLITNLLARSARARVLVGVPVVVAIIALALMVWPGMQAKPVSAAEIWARAQQVTQDGVSKEIRTAHVTTTYQRRYMGTKGVFEGKGDMWFQTPQQVAFKGIERQPDGTMQDTYALYTANARYFVLLGHKLVYIDVPDANAPKTFSPLDLSQVMDSVSNFGSLEDVYTVKLVGTEEVAGRTAYVLERTIKPEAVEQYNMRVLIHKSRLWIDQQYYVLLKVRAWNAEGELVDETNTTSIELNKPVDATLFQFHPPAGYAVADIRPASAGDLAKGWQEAMGQVGATMYAPAGGTSPTVEVGWVTVQQGKPYYAADQNLIMQALSRKVGNRGPLLHALIAQGPPSAIDESRMGTSTGSVQIGSSKGRLYGSPESIEPWALVFDIGRTRVAIYSWNGSTQDEMMETLVGVAESLQQVTAKR